MLVESLIESDTHAHIVEPVLSVQLNSHLYVAGPLQPEMIPESYESPLSGASFQVHVVPLSSRDHTQEVIPLVFIVI
jgi:hypothetical protein